MKPVTMIAAALVTAAAATSAMAGNKLATPQAPDFKVERAQLAIKSPKTNACPAQARMTGWIFTNQAGPVTYMIVHKPGQVSAPKTIEAVEGPGGYVATFSDVFEITEAIDAEYRILVSNSGGVVSNWAPLHANCTIKLGG